MRRACDWLVDRFLMRPPDAATRRVLRLGAYQLVFLGTPAHAAVSSTVSLAPGRTRGMVNAVLRRVASAGVPSSWPDLATRLSYPDWIVSEFVADLGSSSESVLAAMNEAAPVTTRDDGYVQDAASQAVVAALGSVCSPGARVLDVCAGPGGKATGLAALGLHVVAADSRISRAGLVAANAVAVGAVAAGGVASGGVAAGGMAVPLTGVVVADGTRPPWRPGSFDAVLVDAPCSGLGVLRRRPDARWRISPEDVASLALVQRALLSSAAALVSPGGWLAYSVCTLTRAETTEIDDWLAAEWPSFSAVALPAPWEATGRGGRILPGATDGMFLLLLHSRG
jgi:16S rRNA (cytosine967-C5)-methyltransferase